MEIKILKFAMYDKNQEERENISSVILTFYIDKDMQAEIVQFENTESLIEAFRQSSFTAVFIFMDSMDEVDTAWIIKKIAPQCPLIIMSDSGDYSMEGYRLEAFDYWLTPPDATKMRETMSRLSRLLEERSRGDNRMLYIGELEGVTAAGLTPEDVPSRKKETQGSGSPVL